MVSIHDVSPKLRGLVAKVLKGTQVIISSNNEPLVEIVDCKMKIQKLLMTLLWLKIFQTDSLNFNTLSEISFAPLQAILEKTKTLKKNYFLKP